jgi:uncharacterized membrane protein
MLALMSGPYGIVRLLSIVTGRQCDLRGAGALGLTLLFIFTGVGHFMQTEPMSRMLPPGVPEPVLLIYLSGILEFAIAAGFVARRSRRLTGWAAAVMLVLFFPVNIYAAINRVPLGGHAWGPVYLLIRAPLQLAILLWVYWFSIKYPNPMLDTAA